MFWRSLTHNLNIRIPYGDEPLQYADLRLPEGPGPYPVLLLIHGGCWFAEYGGVSNIGKVADAVTDLGVATWTIAYRRVDDNGGGWPGTFQDVARGADHLLTVAGDYSLDPTRIVEGAFSRRSSGVVVG